MRNIVRTGRPTKFKLGTHNTEQDQEDPHQQQLAPWPQGHKVTWCMWQLLADKSRTINVLETPKLVGRLTTPRAMRTSFKVKCEGQGHQADIMLRPELVRDIFRTERPIEQFKLGVQMDEEPYRHGGLWPPLCTSIAVNVTRLERGSNACKTPRCIYTHLSSTVSEI